jgi:hypothetical protein
MTSILPDYTWKERTASVAPWNTPHNMSLEVGRVISLACGSLMMRLYDEAHCECALFARVVAAFLQFFALGRSVSQRPTC